MNQYKVSSQLKTARILALLETPMTIAELADVMCLSKKGMAYWVRGKLRSQVHVAEWRHALTPAYKVGEQEDVKRPKPMTRKQVWRRFFKKLRTDFDRYDNYNAKERARYYMKKPRKPDEITSALFGAALQRTA